MTSIEQAVEAVGGWFVSPQRSPDVESLVARCTAEGARALSPWGPDDLSYLAALSDQLEFLNLSGMADPDLRTLPELPQLLGLSVDAFTGDVDPEALPNLVWLIVNEPTAKQLTSWWDGHPTLRDLALGRFHADDLRPLAGLALQRLDITSRRLSSLDGIETQSTLRTLELRYCPKLASLDGVTAAPTLEMVAVEKCRLIDDLAPLADLPELRLLHLDLATTPDLAVLADHPRLEHVEILGSSTVPGLDELLAAPSLRSVFADGRYWVRTSDGMAHADELPDAMDAERTAIATGAPDEPSTRH